MRAGAGPGGPPRARTADRSRVGAVGSHQLAMATPALGLYCFSSFAANVGNGICGFGSGIMLVLGWQVANLLEMEGRVPFEHTQVLLVAMALPTSIFITCRSVQSSAIDLPVCLVFGVCSAPHPQPRQPWPPPC